MKSLLLFPSLRSWKRDVKGEGECLKKKKNLIERDKSDCEREGRVSSLERIWAKNCVQ